MHEIVFVVFSLLALGAFGAVLETLAPPVLVEMGFWCLGMGLICGLPAGFWYHYRLYLALARRGPVPGRWWFSPSDFHSVLTAQEFSPIRPWYTLGALSFGVALAGGVAVLGGLLLIRPM